MNLTVRAEDIMTPRRLLKHAANDAEAEAAAYSGGFDAVPLLRRDGVSASIGAVRTAKRCESLASIVLGTTQRSSGFFRHWERTSFSLYQDRNRFRRLSHISARLLTQWEAWKNRMRHPIMRS
jgi:hypothetical protein